MLDRSQVEPKQRSVGRRLGLTWRLVRRGLWRTECQGVVYEMVKDPAAMTKGKREPWVLRTSKGEYKLSWERDVAKREAVRFILGQHPS